MKIFLQSQDDYIEIGIIDPINGAFSVSSKIEYPNIEKIPKNGFFSQKYGTTVGFFSNGDNLVLWIDGNEIVLSDSLTVSLETVTDKDKFNKFSITRDQNEVFTLEYPIEVIDPPIEAYQFFNPSITEDHFDIFKFVFNVFNDVHRKNRLIIRWSPKF